LAIVGRRRNEALAMGLFLDPQSTIANQHSTTIHQSTIRNQRLRE